jgi:hypothetical protein
VSLSSIIQESGNVIFAAPPEHGHTTLANYIAYEILSAAKVGANPRLPIYVNLADIRLRSDALLREIRKELAVEAEGVVEPRSLLESRSLVALLDDVDLDSPTNLRRLLASMASLPNIRFIVFGKTALTREIWSLADESIKNAKLFFNSSVRSPRD